MEGASFHLASAFECELLLPPSLEAWFNLSALFPSIPLKQTVASFGCLATKEDTQCMFHDALAENIQTGSI